jgi:site-specific recombinase XerD
MEGHHLMVVKQLAGHSTIKVTEKYAHLAPDLLKTAVVNL